MPTTNSAASAKAGAVGPSANGNGKGHTVTLTHPLMKGIELSGPPTLPATFSWDYAELQSLARDQDEGIMGTLYDLVVSVFGREQAREVRNRIAAKAPSTKDAGIGLLGSILSDVIDAYGTDAGE